MPVSCASATAWAALRKIIPELPEAHHLEPRHIAHLEKDGINETQALVAGIFSATPNLAEELTGHCKAGIIFAYFNEDGTDIYRYGEDRRPFFRLRPDNPAGKAKYLSPKGAPTFIYYPRTTVFNFSRLSSVELVVAEGEKKSLKATLSDIPCIGLGGVTSYRTGYKDEDGKRSLGSLVKDINLFQASKITICFDSDITYKQPVALAIKALTHDLLEAYHQKEIEESESPKAKPQRTLRLSEKLHYALLPNRLNLVDGEDEPQKMGLDDALMMFGRGPVKELFDNALPLAKCKWDDGLQVKCLFAAEPLGDDAKKESPQHAQRHYRGLLFTLAAKGLFCTISDFGKYRYSVNEGLWAEIGDETWRSLSESVADAQRWKNRKRDISLQQLSFASGTERLQVDKTQLDRSHLLGFKNGVLDLNANKLLPHSPNHYITQKLGFSYNTEATCNKWLTWLNWVFDGDEQWPIVIQALLKWTLTPKQGNCSYPIQVWPILIGPAGRGKGTFLDVLSGLLGVSQCAWSYRTVKDGRSMYGLWGKKAGIAADLKGELNTTAVGNINAIASNEPLEIEAKYKNQQTERFNTVLWAAMNQPIKSRVVDQEGLSRRILYIGFERKPEEIDTQLGKRLLGELPGIFNWAWSMDLDDAISIIKTHLRSDVNVKLQQQHLASSNSVYEWMQEMQLESATTAIIKSEWYARYKGWATESNYKSLGYGNWKEAVLKAGATIQTNCSRGTPLTIPAFKNINVKSMLGLFN